MRGRRSEKQEAGIGSVVLCQPLNKTSAVDAPARKGHSHPFNKQSRLCPAVLSLKVKSRSRVATLLRGVFESIAVSEV